MGFSINFLLEPVANQETSSNTATGIIIIGSFQERFLASLEFWNKADYERHWKEAVYRLITTSDVSCLVTSMYDPVKANFIIWWPMYRDENIIFVQNQILFLDTLPIQGDLQDLFALVPKRQTINEEGTKLSEWSMPIEDLQLFLKSK